METDLIKIKRLRSQLVVYLEGQLRKNSFMILMNRILKKVGDSSRKQLDLLPVFYYLIIQ